ncbi:MAG: HPr family phosphocarrier protein [Epulopiscium sp.]|nr:HPr family phosphocarrier protein [Candidatus Epulonipiscium sp.]
MRKTITINSVSDIQKINSIITQYPFEVWIHSDNSIVDAKSILGMFVLGLNEPMYMVIDDDVNPDSLIKELSPYVNFLD